MNIYYNFYIILHIRLNPKHSHCPMTGTAVEGSQHLADTGVHSGGIHVIY